MKKNRSFCKTLLLTAGLNLLLLGNLYLFSLLVHAEPGQALLFLTVTLLLTVGICLFAVIPVSGRGILWGCFGITSALHLPLTTIAVLTGGSALSEAWPGDNLAALLLFLMSFCVWEAGTFWVTVVRSRRRGKAIREEQRNIKRASKGFTKEWQTLSPARGRTVAVLRGILLVTWAHVLTFLLIEWLVSEGLEESILSYVAFPMLWSLMAALYGLYDRFHRVAFTVSVAVTNLALFLLPTALLTVANTPVHRFRFILHLDSVLTTPLDNPEQMLVIGVFTTVWAAMIVFGIGHKRQKI